MKRYCIVTIALLAPLSLANFAQAQSVELLNFSESLESKPQILAGFGISLPGGGRVEVDDDDDSDESSSTSSSESTTAPSSFSGFSGESEGYLDDYNGFSVDVPVEYTLNGKGQSTDWIGPIVDGGAVSIYVNAAPLPGVDPYTLQQTYKQQYEQDRFYTEVVETTVPYGNSTVPALRVKEVNNQRGTRDSKAPDDIHRWHLFVFGNERVYTWGFTGMFETFEQNRVQTLYEDVIDSIELVSIVE